MAAIGGLANSEYSNGLSVLAAAQNSLNGTARRISEGTAGAIDIVELLQSKNQSSVGVKLIQAEDNLTRKTLDILA